MAVFEKLQVWQRAVALSVEVYKETRDLRDFGFRDQITRASLSIPSNIAEGIERSSKADQLRFLDYARSSCAEVRTQAIVGNRVGFISDESYKRWAQETKEIAAMLRGLARAIQNAEVKEEKSPYAYDCSLLTAYCLLPT